MNTLGSIAGDQNLSNMLLIQACAYTDRVYIKFLLKFIISYHLSVTVCSVNKVYCFISCCSSVLTNPFPFLLRVFSLHFHARMHARTHLRTHSRTHTIWIKEHACLCAHYVWLTKVTTHILSVHFYSLVSTIYGIRITVNILEIIH